MTFKQSTALVAVALFVGLIGHMTSSAQSVPRMLHYDGRLLDDDVPAEGSFEVTFAMYPGAEGGDPLWSEVHEVTVDDGLFSVLLGSVNPFPPTIPVDHDALYLSMRVDDNPEMSPRLVLASTTFALRAGLADGVRDQSIGTSALADAAVSSEKLADNAVTQDKLANAAVTEDKLADGSVTSDKLAAGAGGTGDISAVTAGEGLTGGGQSGAVTLGLVDRGVTNDKVADEAISTEKLEDSAVTGSKIAEGSVTGAHIADGAVTATELTENAVVSSRLSNGAVITGKIADRAVTTAKIADQAVTGDKLASGAAVTSLNGLTSGVTLEEGRLIGIEEVGNGIIRIDYEGGFSSRRWKTDIEPLNDPLGIVQKLRGVTFAWKEDGRRDIGLIAEEVGAVLPEIVEFEENGRDAIAVNYGRLVSVLIEAVKAQQQELETYRDVVDELSTRLERVERLTRSTMSTTDVVGQDRTE